MHTHSSSNLPIVSPNPSTSNPKRRNRRRSKQPFIIEESPIDTMADQRTMAELLRAPTEGYAEAIVAPPILADQFELKHSLINIMITDQFFGLEKDNPHDHIRWGSPSMDRKRTPTFYSYLGGSCFKFINEFFPPSRTTNLRNEISNFRQRFDESFHEAWDRYKDFLRACPHHGFTELHQLDTFYNALNLADQDSLNAAAVSSNPPPAFVKAVAENCVTLGGAHPYYQCLAAGGNIFPELRDNIQGYVSATVLNYNHGNFVYRPPGLTSLPSNTVANPKGKLKAITTRSGIVLDGPTVPTPPPFINPEEDECVEETLTEPDLSEYTIKVPPPPVQKYKPPSQREYIKLPKKLGDPRKFLISCGFSELKCKALANLGTSINLMPLSVWKKLGLPKLISTCITLELANRAICTPTEIKRDVFVPVGKFTFPADFVIVDYESDPRVHLILGRPFLRTDRALIDVHGEEMILRDGDERLTLNMRHDTSSYSNQPQKESINLINVFNNSSEDFLKNLFSTNQPSGNPTFSSHPELTSPEVQDDIFDFEGGNVLPKKLLDLDSTKDLHPPLHVNPVSGSTTYSYPSSPLLEELADELALITFPLKYDDDLQFDVESDLKEIEFLLYQDIDSSLKDLIDQSNLANPADNFVDSMPEMFTDEHALDYSSPSIFDEYDDDFFRS
nr:reverse transcriptase domain-containing protein [Tanacetum cinerariifolium]